MWSIDVAGDFVICGCDENIKVWNLAKGDSANTLMGHQDHVWGVHVLDECMISCSEDCTVRIWVQNEGYNNAKQIKKNKKRRMITDDDESSQEGEITDNLPNNTNNNNNNNNNDDDYEDDDEAFETIANNVNNTNNTNNSNNNNNNINHMNNLSNMNINNIGLDVNSFDDSDGDDCLYGSAQLEPLNEFEI